jgi:hypothetical protein
MRLWRSGFEDPGMLDRTTLIDDLAAVTKPIGEANGLPNGLYADPDGFDLETRRIFHGGWACVGVGADVPNPGDAQPIDFLGVPLCCCAIMRANCGCSRMSAATAA